ncbi:hypothetical protein [Sphingomonas faeni]|uniref:hypothetical protein n=1 Tax=Sphingomonas faeni TaxID=185950 RepID=UPI0011B2928D|nr:hypothetical protein [Sphingomonas faeni]
MENSNLDGFFSHDTSNEPETVIEETAPEVIETEVATPEDEAPAEVSDPVEPSAKTEDRSKWVPVDALISERTKAKQSSDEAASLRQQIADYRLHSRRRTSLTLTITPLGITR